MFIWLLKVAVCREASQSIANKSKTVRAPELGACVDSHSGQNEVIYEVNCAHLEQVLDVIGVLRVVEWPASWLAAPRPPGLLQSGVRARNAELRTWLDTELERALSLELGGSERWAPFVPDVQRLVESGAADPSGRFTGCSAAYLRLLGGHQRANKGVHKDLNDWAPLCRTLPTADQLERHAHTLMDEPAVTVTNIHQAKGLEWDHVFVVGATEGVLPDFRAQAQGTMDTERSLLYVAVTRAQHPQSLGHAPTYGRQARQTSGQSSRFLIGASCVV